MAVSLLLLGRRIREARKQKKFTQEQLAERMDCSLRFIVSPSHMSKVERGENQISLLALGRLCDVLDVPFELIASGASVPANPEYNQQFTAILQDCDEQTIAAMLDICQRVKDVRNLPK